MSENERAIIEWVNTFEIDHVCYKFTDVNDGLVVAKMLAEIVPSFFGNDNFVLSSDPHENIRKTLTMLDNYYSNVLRKHVDVSSINVHEIVATADEDDIMLYLELVIGVAVMCEDKAKFITNIFQLGTSAQGVLKGLVENIMHTAVDLDGGGDEEEAAGNEESSAPDHGRKDRALSEDENSGEVVRHLQAERTRLLTEVNNAQSEVFTLKQQVKKLKEENAAFENEREALTGNSDLRESTISSLHREVDALKTKVDEMSLERTSLQSEQKATMQKLQASQEMLAQLEMETRQQSDELDIARDKISRLAKAEQAVEKYQKKLEDMRSLREQNKELSDKMDEYLDQIQDLEAANKSMSSLNKMVEQYKNRAVELEREKFEAQSSSEMKDAEIQRWEADYQKVLDQKRRCEDDVQVLKEKVTMYEEAHANEQKAGSPAKQRTASDFSDEASAEDGMFEVETVSSLKEKVKKLERQIKAGSASSGSTGGSSSAEAQSLRDENLILQQELDDVRQMKKDREDMIIAAKKNAAELQQELVRVKRELEDGNRSKKSTDAQGRTVEEVARKLGESQNTVGLLERRLKEKEDQIIKLEQNLKKLSNLAKTSVNTFKVNTSYNI